MIIDEFTRVNADIDMDIMTASMKDQYFGDIDKLQQRFAMQLRKLARRWQIHRTSFLTDSQPELTELIDSHRTNVRDHAHWTSKSLQRTIGALSSWVVIPADHFPSRAHVICPSLFAALMHKTFCTGEVFSLCRESAASFRSEVVTTLPSLLLQRYAWGLRLQALLPTARILPKPTKDWQKARPIISFFRTWAAPFLTVFGALIFELTLVQKDAIFYLSMLMATASSSAVHQYLCAYSGAALSEFFVITFLSLSIKTLFYFSLLLL